MKSLRHILITSVLTLCLFGSVLYTSCKNKCGSTTCQNGGTCADNVCECPIGYSGGSCQTGWSDASIGTYTCTRANCNIYIAGATSWLSAVTKDATNGGFTVDISNFDNSNITVVATIDSTENGTTQVMRITPATGAYGVNANGIFTISNSIINLHYTTSSPTGASQTTCDMVLVKE